MVWMLAHTRGLFAEDMDPFSTVDDAPCQGTIGGIAGEYDAGIPPLQVVFQMMAHPPGLRYSINSTSMIFSHSHAPAW